MEEAKISVYSFFLGAIPLFGFFINSHNELFSFCILLFLCIILNIVLIHVICKCLFIKVTIISELLGFTFAFSIMISLYIEVHMKMFAWYFSILSFFHFTEYFCIAIVNPDSLSLNSFLLNHSNAYILAVFCSGLEFILEYLFIPEIKQPLISYTGVIICLTGECIRKASILTAKSNFHHLVQMEKPKNHQLVTTGIYGIFRHPSYVGWFLWSIGTQIMLINPVCFVIYLIVSWNFFNERIFLEEWTLYNFYGELYEMYQKKVPSGIPFIYGYKPSYN